VLTWRCATPFVSSDVSECRRFGIKLEPSRKPASNPWIRNIDSRGTLAGKISNAATEEPGRARRPSECRLAAFQYVIF